MNSKKPNAKKFQHWITSEVIPQLRILPTNYISLRGAKLFLGLHSTVAAANAYRDTLRTVCAEHMSTPLGFAPGPYAFSNAIPRNAFAGVFFIECTNLNVHDIFPSLRLTFPGSLFFAPLSARTCRFVYEPTVEPASGAPTEETILAGFAEFNQTIAAEKGKHPLCGVLM